MPGRRAVEVRPSEKDAASASFRRRWKFLEDMERYRHRIPPDRRRELVERTLALCGDLEPRIRNRAGYALGRLRILYREGHREEVGAAVRALVADTDPDVRRTAREALARLGGVLPETSREGLADDFLALLRRRRDCREGAEGLGWMAGAVPASKRAAVVGALGKVASRGGEDAAPAVAALARLAPSAAEEAGRIRVALVEALRSGAAGSHPEHLERAFAPLSFAPAVADEAFASAILEMAEARDASARLRAMVALEAVRPALPPASLPRCFEAALRCLVDRDRDLREQALGALSQLLLALPALPGRAQVALARRAAKTLPRLNLDQRIGLMSRAHSLDDVLPPAIKEILIGPLLADTRRADPRGIGYALHAAAALATGCRAGLVERVASRVAEVGRQGPEEARGEACEAWGDLLDIESEGLRTTAVEELLRLERAGVQSSLGDPWSILETNRKVLPAGTASELVKAFLSLASGAGAERNLRDAAGVVIELAHRRPGSLPALAPREATDAALERILESLGADPDVLEGTRALTALAHLLPGDRMAVIVDRLGTLVKALPAGPPPDEDEEEGTGPGRHAVAEALGDLLQCAPAQLHEGIAGHLGQLCTGTRPEPQALKGLAMGGDRDTRASAIDRLLKIAAGHGDEDLWTGAVEVLGEIADIAGPRLPEIADALLLLVDEPSDYGPATAIEALKPVYRRLPERRSAILSRLVEAVEEDGDSNAAVALAELGPDIPEESRAPVLETLERACRDAAGTRDDWRFARAVRESARHLAPERRGEIERSVRHT